MIHQLMTPHILGADLPTVRPTAFKEATCG